MNLKRMTALLKRELIDILRDKKTLVMMVVLPIILYPLLVVGMTFLMGAVVNSQEEKIYRVAFEKETGLSDAMRQIIEEHKEELRYRLEITECRDPEEALLAEEIDVYVKAAGEHQYELCYLSAKDRSQTALGALRDALDYYVEALQKKTVAAAGLDVEAVLSPITLKTVDRSTTEESVGNMIGSIMPFFIVTSILLGAIYPAIDVTAGEKERGTLETLLTLPVTNFEMIMSKFLAVSAIACVSAFLNVFSMGGAMLFLVSGSFASMGNVDIAIHYETFVPGILFTLPVMAFFALFVTAVCMCTCVFAKSFKEANNYATPVLLVFMLGSYAAMLPDFELGVGTAALPIVNVALLIEGLFSFTYDYGLFAMVLFSNAAYALLAVMILGKLYNSEAVLFAEGFGSVKLFSKRSEMKKNQMPGIGDLVLILSITLLLLFYVGTYAQLHLGFGGVAVQQGMILLCPIIYAWYMRADAERLFSLKRSRLSKLAGSMLLGIGAFVAALFAGAVLTPWFPGSAGGLTQMDEMLASCPTGWLVLVVALMPAVGEELLFRGFVFGTLREKCKPFVAVTLTALLFAAYHMSLLKMFTMTIIGLALTYAVYKSGSIVTSMCMHFINNLLSVLIVKYPAAMQKIAPVFFKERLTAPEIALLLLIAAVCCGAGLLLLQMKTGRKK